MPLNLTNKDLRDLRVELKTAIKSNALISGPVLVDMAISQLALNDLADKWELTKAIYSQLSDMLNKFEIVLHPNTRFE